MHAGNEQADAPWSISSIESCVQFSIAYVLLGQGIAIADTFGGWPCEYIDTFMCITFA